MPVVRDSRRLLGLSALACLLSIVQAHADSSGTLQVAFTYQGTSPAVSILVTLASLGRVRQARADKAGKVEFSALPFQTYELEASSASFVDISLSNIQITSSDPIRLDIPLKIWSPSPRSERGCSRLFIGHVSGSDQQIVYEERTGKVNLTGIVDSQLNRPLKDATIALVRPETSENKILQANSDENGVYDFNDLEPGKYSLMVSRNGTFVKPDQFQFWVAKENLTRLGRISFAGSCGDQVIQIYPEIRQISIPPPELVMPFPLPLPPRPKYFCAGVHCKIKRRHDTKSQFP